MDSKRKSRKDQIYWLKQLSIIVLLCILAFVIDKYMTNPARSIENNALTMAIVAAVVIVACNQLLYNYAERNENFMKSSAWNYMYLYLFILLFFSFIVFMFLFSIFSQVQANLWVIGVGFFYLIFLLNMLVLSIVHKLVEADAKKKIMLTGTASILLLFFSFFIF